MLKLDESLLQKEDAQLKALILEQFGIWNLNELGAGKDEWKVSHEKHNRPPWKN